MWDQFLEGEKTVNDFLNGIVWGWPVVILILSTGILLTVRTRFLQVTHFGESLNTTIIPALKSLGKRHKNKDTRLKSVSQFEAFSTAISGTVGTDNINGLVAKITKNYFDRKRGKKVEPMLSAYPDMNEEFKQDILTENAGMH